MGRTNAIAVAGAILALGFAGAALADARAPTPAGTVLAARTQAVAARAHLSYKPGSAAFEGALTVIEQRTALTTLQSAPTDPEAPLAEVAPVSTRYLILTRTSEGAALRQESPDCALAQRAAPTAPRS